MFRPLGDMPMIYANKHLLGESQKRICFHFKQDSRLFTNNEPRCKSPIYTLLFFAESQRRRAIDYFLLAKSGVFDYSSAETNRANPLFRSSYESKSEERKDRSD